MLQCLAQKTNTRIQLTLVPDEANYCFLNQLHWKGTWESDKLGDNTINTFTDDTAVLISSNPHQRATLEEDIDTTQ